MNTPPGRLNLGRRVTKPRFQSNGYSAERRARQSDARRGGWERAHLFERAHSFGGDYFPALSSFSAAGAIAGMLAFRMATFSAARSFDWISCHALNCRSNRLFSSSKTAVEPPVGAVSALSTVPCKSAS